MKERERKKERVNKREIERDREKEAAGDCAWTRVQKGEKESETKK